MIQQLKTTVLAIAVASIVLCLPLKGVAQDARIAFVDTQELTLGSDEGKVAGDKLQKRLDVIRVEMDKLRKDIEDKENSLRARERILTAASKTSEQRKIDDEKVAFERKAQDYEKEMNELQSTLISPIADKVRVELAAYVKEKGYTLVLDLAAEDANIVWANQANNVTKEVLVRLNENFKRSGGVPATSTPAAAPKPPAQPQPGATPPALTPTPGTPTRPPATTPTPSFPPGAPATK